MAFFCDGALKQFHYSNFTNSAQENFVHNSQE